MTDDDALDPVIADRFRPLDDVPVPDTWSESGAVVPLGRRRPRRSAWMIGIAAATVIALVTGFVFLRSGEDAGELATVDATTAALPDATSATTEASATTYVLPTALATADPAVVARQSLITITPSATVERYCTDIVAVLPVGDGPVIGQVLGGSTWQPVPDGAPGPTWPACGGTVTDTLLALTVPDVADGSYRFCIAAGELPEGCALVAVRGDVPVQPAVADPPFGIPGAVVQIAPATAVRRTCEDIVTVHEESFDYVIGQVLADGTWVANPAGGAAMAVPACDGTITADPVRVVLPPIPGNRYEFCVSPDRTPSGCAIIGIYTFAGTASIEPTSAAPGSVVTLTPAGAVARGCGDALWVSAVADPTIIGQVLATGEWVQTDAGAPAAPTCPPSVAADPFTFVVPPLAPGDYGFCLGADRAIEGCASLTVLPTVGVGIAATADPAVAAPGEAVTITPAAVVPRICTNIVNVLATDPPELIGATGVDGFFSPITEDGLIVPDCAEPDSADPLPILVPDLEPGVYQFCLSSDLRPESCAVVEIVGV